MPVVAILFFRMRLISVPEKLTPQWTYPANVVNLGGVVFHLRVLTPKISMRGDDGVANAKPKYPPDASSG